MRDIPADEKCLEMRFLHRHKRDTETDEPTDQRMDERTDLLIDMQGPI